MWTITALIATSCSKSSTVDAPLPQQSATPTPEAPSTPSPADASREVSPEPTPEDPRAIVDAALKKHGDLGPSGDLSAGLDQLETEFTVQLSPEDERILVSLAPLSGEGHDFSFDVSRTTGEISNVAVGTVLPPPEL